MNKALASALSDYRYHKIAPTHNRLALALLQNDLWEAANLMSEQDYADFPEIVKVLGNLPRESWGSVHAYNNWISSGCNGEHTWGPAESECCSAYFFTPGWPDSGICGYCREHAAAVRTCEVCEFRTTEVPT